MITQEEARQLLQLGPQAQHKEIEEKYQQYRRFSLEQLQHISDPKAQEAIQQHLQRLEEAHTFLLAITPYQASKDLPNAPKKPQTPPKSSLMMRGFIGCGSIFLLIIVVPLLMEVWNQYSFRDCPARDAKLCTALKRCKNSQDPQTKALSCWEAAKALHHVGTQESRSLALWCYHKSCELQVAKSCNNLGYLLIEGVRPPDKQPLQTSAKHSFDKSCSLRDPQGCNNLAVYYEKQKGTSAKRRANREKALQFYQKACTLGGAAPCRNLAIFYEKHKPYQKQRIIDAYRRACELGDAGGCRNMGILHERRRIEQANCTDANRYYQRACQLGDRPLCSYQCSHSSTP